MTLEQQKQIEREFADAKTPDEITKAQTHAILALVECQRKTGERVKKLSWKVFAVIFGGGSGAGAILTHIEQIQKFFS